MVRGVLATVITWAVPVCAIAQGIRPLDTASYARAVEAGQTRRAEDIAGDQMPMVMRALQDRSADHLSVAPFSIVIETQFGRAHRATGALIDFSIWIDVPLEVALARKVKAFTAAALAGEPSSAHERLQWLDGYLAGYLALVRRLLLVQAEKVRPQADLVIDGGGDPAALARLAGAEVRRRLGRA